MKLNLINLSKLFSFVVVTLTIIFFLNIILTNFFNWPGSKAILSFIFSSNDSLKSFEIFLSFIQFSLYFVSLFFIYIYIFKINKNSLAEDSKQLSDLAAYITRAAFWTVFLVGLVDLLISFLVSEKAILDSLPSGLAQLLFQPRSRILYVHVPLTVFSFLYALKNKSIGFIWLALLVVFAESLIVISRFVFSYEQAFMGDLVRYWYAALFLFGSAYTLLKDGHVRVDILYVNFKEKNKALANIFGSIFFGMPICFLILYSGMGSKTGIINAPILSFEISQQAQAGLYIKYMMASFLTVFAISMIIQFCSLILANLEKFEKNK
ncbi:MAG: TRAP transporter small permease subunit [Pelagibacteraceae bacterium]|jgi:TRAP-type mannitol/chloroaromatic compound transport system permease small subunit